MLLFNREARQLGLSGKEALDRIKKGKAGDNYLWSHLNPFGYHALQ